MLKCLKKMFLKKGWINVKNKFEKMLHLGK